MNNKSKKHPAFALISWCHTNGNTPSLWGSHVVDADRWITIRIRAGEEDENGAPSLDHAAAKILELDISCEQFAQFLTSPAYYGDGVPCTIRVNHGAYVEPPPHRKGALRQAYDAAKDELERTRRENKEVVRHIRDLLDKEAAKRFDTKKLQTIHEHLDTLEFGAQRQVDRSIYTMLSASKKMFSAVKAELTSALWAGLGPVTREATQLRVKHLTSDLDDLPASDETGISEDDE